MIAGYHQNPLFTIKRAIFFLSAPALFLIAPFKADSAPATNAEMATLNGIAAVNLCLSLSSKTEFPKAAQLATETLAQWVLIAHKGEIQQAGPKPISIEDLRRGLSTPVVLTASELCPAQFPPDILKQAQEEAKKIKSAKPPSK